MIVRKLIFSGNRIGYTTGEPDSLILNKKQAIKVEDFEVTEEEKDLLMENPGKLEIKKTKKGYQIVEK